MTYREMEAHIRMYLKDMITLSALQSVFTPIDRESLTDFFQGRTRNLFEACEAMQILKPPPIRGAIFYESAQAVLKRALVRNP